MNINIQVEDLCGLKVQKFSLMDVWDAAWHWMREEGGIKFIPGSLPERGADRWNGVVDFSGSTPEKMAYYITEHYEGRQSEPPDHLRKVILGYKVHMMNEWGWPEWGYKDVKYLKEEHENSST